MVWKIKNKEQVQEVPIEIPEIDLEENLDSEEEELKRKIKALEDKIESNKERRKVPEIEPKVQVKESKDQGLNKQEVIDAIQGNLARASQLIELLRR